MVKYSTLSGIKSQGPDLSLLRDIPYLNKATLSTILKKKGDALNYWVKRLIDTGEIVPLKKGLYVSRSYLLKIEGDRPLFDRYREYLAGLLRSPSYISLEYAMARYGIIPDVPFAVTSVTNKSSRRFTNEFGTYIFRNVKGALFCGYKEELFGEKRYYIATPVKALFDFVYLRKFGRSGFRREIEEGLRINWDYFTKDDFRELEDYMERSGKRKMKRFLDIVVKGRLI